MATEDTNPLCDRCGGTTWKRGFETYAAEPHKRRKYTCKKCGHLMIVVPVQVGGNAENVNAESD